MIDDGCTVEGYQSDITRTFVLGKADRQDEEGLRHRPPGADRGAEGGAARRRRSKRSTPPAARSIVDAGYGPGFKYFTHRLGHGMGMDGHEWPYLVKNNMFGWDKALKLQPGMVFSDEPGIYIRGEFGVRLEDDMHITRERRRAVHAAEPVDRGAVRARLRACVG